MSDTPKIVVAGPIRDTGLGKGASTGPLGALTGRIAGTRVANGSGNTLGMGATGAGIPAVLATGSPLAVFKSVLTRADKMSLFRYFNANDPFVGRAIELHSELPMSRVTITPPKGPSSRQNQEINKIYESMCERLGILQLLLEIAREYWMVGDVYIWHEWDEEALEWSNIYILPVEYSHTIVSPYVRGKEVAIFARPLVDTSTVRRMTDRDLYMNAGDIDIDALLEDAEEDLPSDLKQLLEYGEGVPLNTDPNKGSYVFHISRNRPPNEPYGQGIIERCLEPLLRLENLKNAQLQISGRNMQPKHLIYGEGLSEPELNSLRAQVDLAILDNVDYPIVTNFPVHWETINAQERLLNVDTEYETLREDLATGLGTTKDLLTGQATYGGQRITLEMMNTQYLMFREIIRDYVEKGIFRPVAEAKGHYFYEEIPIWVKVEPQDLEPGDEIIQEHDGSLRKKKIQTNKVYNHSKVRFNRLSIRDNAEVYDQLFRLHQKGSLALNYLLDIHNIDGDENASSLLNDIATVKDPTFNRLIEGIYMGAAEHIIAGTDIIDRIISSLNLDKISSSLGEPSPGGSLGGGAPPLDGSMDMDPGSIGEGGIPEVGAPMAGVDVAQVPGAIPGTPATVSSSFLGETAALSGKLLTEDQINSLIKVSKTSKKVLSKSQVLNIVKKSSKSKEMSHD
jgi:hypothetical protein